MIGDVQLQAQTQEPVHVHDDENTFHWFSPGMYVLYAIGLGFLFWCVKRRMGRKAT